MEHAVKGKCICDNEHGHVVVNEEEWLSDDYPGVRLYCTECNHTWTEV